MLFLVSVQLFLEMAIVLFCVTDIGWVMNKHARTSRSCVSSPQTTHIYCVAHPKINYKTLKPFELEHDSMDDDRQRESFTLPFLVLIWFA